jgi:hypothetical protein
MAIIGSIFALLGRAAGRLVNSALGWATLLLFGKVEGRKQTILLVIALGSVVWVLALVGIAFPDIGAFMIAFVPVTDFIDVGVVRLAMLAVALLIPVLVGVAAMFIAEPRSRPRGIGIVGGVVRGYPFTFVLAVTIAILALASLIRKIRSLARRWENAHVPVIVKAGGYERVLADLRAVLHDADLQVEPTPAPAILSVPPRLLDAVAGKALGGLVPDRLVLLKGDALEVLVYPSDVAVSGTRQAVARARAAIAAQLTDSPAYLTASAEAERLEDEIRNIADAAERADPAAVDDLVRRVKQLDERIATLIVPFDEWETVYRERLQIERDLLSRRVERRANAVVASGVPTSTAPGERPTAGPLSWLAAGVAIGLLALDVALLVSAHLGRPRRRLRSGWLVKSGGNG